MNFEAMLERANRHTQRVWAPRQSIMGVTIDLVGDKNKAVLSLHVALGLAADTADILVGRAAGSSGKAGDDDACAGAQRPGLDAYDNALLNQCPHYNPQGPGPTRR